MDQGLAVDSGGESKGCNLRARLGKERKGDVPGSAKFELHILFVKKYMYCYTLGNTKRYCEV